MVLTFKFKKPALGLWLFVSTALWQVLQVNQLEGATFLKLRTLIFAHGDNYILAAPLAIITLCSTW